MGKNEKTSHTFEKAALDLIESEYTITLSTTGQDGPWSAPVYYVFSNGAFYFFSSPSSRHIEQALDSSQAAASLYYQSDTWESIRGIQMSGVVKKIRSFGSAAKVIALYLKRYPFTRSFFTREMTPDLDAFSKHFNAKLYAFFPSVVFYTDNRFGFGKSQKLAPHELSK